MSHYLDLEGKRALVTGGTKGVGAAVVEALREAGAAVLTTARSQPEKIAYVDHFVATDVSTAEGCAVLAKAVHDRLGGIDIIVHVVGGSSAPAGGFAALDDDEWQKALDQNLLAAVRLDRALLPSMIEQGAGVIIHITSIQRQIAAARGDDRLCGGQSGTLELQQGPVQGSESQGCARRSRIARMGRDGRSGRPRQGDRSPERHRAMRVPKRSSWTRSAAFRSATRRSQRK